LAKGIDLVALVTQAPIAETGAYSGLKAEMFQHKLTVSLLRVLVG
jgi:hypothetical protein